MTDWQERIVKTLFGDRQFKPVSLTLPKGASLSDALRNLSQ